MSAPTMGPTRPQHRKMHALWRTAQVADRADRLALTAAVVGRGLRTSNELTVEEAGRVIDYLERLDADGVLAEKAAGWLGARVGTPAEQGSAADMLRFVEHLRAGAR